jgi:TetR/AcrR family transcriptional regulator
LVRLNGLIIWLKMVADKENTEEKILQAAKEVFIEKGNDGARMQEIADKAGINKSLLHYYYRTKEKLFGAVFKFAFAQFAPKVLNAFNTDEDFFTQLEKFISIYIDIISKNSFIPMFILNEVNRKKTSFIPKVIKGSGINIDFFQDMIKKEVEKGTIRDIAAEQLIVNIIGMCIFPFVGRPILQVVVFKDDSAAFDEFLESRKKEVADFVIRSIKK